MEIIHVGWLLSTDWPYHIFTVATTHMHKNIRAVMFYLLSVFARYKREKIFLIKQYVVGMDN